MATITLILIIFLVIFSRALTNYSSRIFEVQTHSPLKINILNEKTEILQSKIFDGIIGYFIKCDYNYINFWINLPISVPYYSCTNSPSNDGINNYY